jgi:hypothetical protein
MIFPKIKLDEITKSAHILAKWGIASDECIAAMMDGSKMWRVNCE